MTFRNRRVVTGLDGEGKSCVIFDGGLDQIPACQASPTIIWCTDQSPVSNAGNSETAKPFEPGMFESCSSMFLLLKAEPGNTEPAWHATNTIDYIIVLSGRIELALEAGSVELGAGDLVVDRGVNHCWKVIGDEPVVMAVTLIRAESVGAGSRFDEHFRARFPTTPADAVRP